MFKNMTLALKYYSQNNSSISFFDLQFKIIVICHYSKNIKEEM
jgi:hypothetical protein